MEISAAKLKLQISRTLLYVFLIILAVLCIIPFYIMIVNGSRTNVEINTGVTLIPGSNIIGNMKTILIITANINFFMGFVNSTIVAVCATTLSIYIASLTAYGFVFYEFPLKKVCFGIIMASMMIPAQLGLIGLYDLYLRMNLLDSLLALILPAGAAAATVYFLRQYIRSVLPEYIIQAARIDGAHDLSIFHRIALPIMSPGIATMAIFGFVFNWNNFLLPLIVLTTEDNYTLPLMVAQLNSSLYARDYGAIYLAVALSIFPIIVVFAFLQRFLITGVSFGSLKE
ncbi:MAG: carbohydrate ABC transporter permease [Spirochaetales bacterium]|nr:carbohydrate ABC transporter permease [Spirochaetales bacterium]